MDKKEVKKHNRILQKAYSRLIEEAEDLKKDVIEPCIWCNKAGQLHYNLCNSCANNFFEDFSLSKKL